MIHYSRMLLALAVTATSALAQAETSATVCQGVEDAPNADPHATIRGVRVVLDDAKGTAVVSTYAFEAHAAYLGAAIALVDANKTGTETFPVRYEHDDFGAYLMHPKDQYVVATIIGSGEEREWVRDENGERFAVSLSCAR